MTKQALGMLDAAQVPPEPSGRRRVGRFIALAILSAGLSFGLTIGLHEYLGLSEDTSYGIALITVFLVNFVGMRAWVFAAGQGRVTIQFVSYVATAAGFRGFEYAAFLLLHNWLGVQYILAILLIQGISFVAKFFFYGGVVFRKPQR